MEKCPTCKGTGEIASTSSQGPEWWTCDDCDGTGTVTSDRALELEE